MLSVQVTESVAVAISASIEALKFLGFKNPTPWIREIRASTHEEGNTKREVSVTFWVWGEGTMVYAMKILVSKSGAIDSGINLSEWKPIAIEGCERGTTQSLIFSVTDGEIVGKEGIFPFESVIG